MADAPVNVAGSQGSGGSVSRLAALVDGYARGVTPGVLSQHSGASVSSALGIWLLLAACVSAAQGSERSALEEALGCSGDEAVRLLASFAASPPSAVSAALAVWVRASDATVLVADWVRSLPEGVESGPMPGQAQADAWAERETLGLIKTFPLEIDRETRIVLASALATKVSWQVPFDVVAAADYLASSSPWRSVVSRLLWDGHPGEHAMIARTEAAGLVAVHRALAKADEDVAVVSVCAAPEVDRAQVVAAAYEVAVGAAGSGAWAVPRCSLYDLPLGPGHSWEISEREVPTWVKKPPRGRIAGAALPAWKIDGRLDLARSAAFATGPAFDALRKLIGPRPDDSCDAVQVAIASFNRYGFKAAAVTTFGVAAAAMRAPSARALERTAVLRFDHPYAAVAVAPSFSDLPLFTAWVADPIEPED
jgi:Serpin (serine protease inhibitor)